MENRKGMMKSLLLENLRKLMTHTLFEKITIKQICDETGVIRATFYNYFDDKYDCLNAIVFHDFAEQAFSSSENMEDLRPVIHTILTNVDENRAFYKSAYQVTGQNNFEDMIRKNLCQIIEEYFKRYRKPGFMNQYPNDLISQYYAEGMAFEIKAFVFQQDTIQNVEQAEKMIVDFVTHSFMDYSTQVAKR